jgi:Rieske Fe-S protein
VGAPLYPRRAQGGRRALNRREFIKRLVVSGFLVGTSVSAVYEMIARSGAGQQQQSVSVIQQPSSQTGSQSGSASVSQVQAPAGYVFVASQSSLSGKTSAYFQHPAYGLSLLISLGGQWKAFSATCTHQPCTVQYGGGSSIVCPCHGASFSTNNGSVLGGPAPKALPEFGVQTDGSGNLFVSSSVIN